MASPRVERLAPVPPLITARLLGAPELRIDGEPPPLDLLWRKHLALCLALWCAPERRRSRDQLIGLLWADKPESAARHSLNEALRVVRRSGGAEAIDADVATVRWIGAIDLDLDRFAASETSDVIAAASLVAGDFCDGFSVPGAEAFNDWLDGERRSWRGRAVAALVTAAALAEDRGDVERAVGLAERGCRLDSHSDSAARAAMRARWLRGDRSGALEFGAAFRSRLRDEVGIDPDERTTALLRRITSERRPREVAADSVPLRRQPLIARDALLERLMREWRSASAQARPALLVISGAPGTGRSRLLAELVDRAGLEDATVATLRALDIDRDDASAVFLGLALSGLHLAPGVPGAAPAAIATFASRLPQWSERFAAGSGETLSVREAFAAILHAAAAERPVLLAIDDADRLGDAALGEMVAILRLVPGCSVTVAITLNRRAVRASLDELRRATGRDVTGVQADVDPLGADAMTQLVANALPEWAADAQARLGRRLLAESAGLPAIAVEVLGAVTRGLPLDIDAAPWPAPDRTLDATMPGDLPDSLAAAVRLDFGRLAPEARELLQFASLLPEPFTSARLGRLLTAPGTATRDVTLDALEWDGWLVSDGRGYSFPARAVRTVLASQTLTPGARRRLEERIAAS